MQSSKSNQGWGTNRIISSESWTLSWLGLRRSLGADDPSLSLSQASAVHMSTDEGLELVRRWVSACSHRQTPGRSLIVVLTGTGQFDQIFYWSSSYNIGIYPVKICFIQGKLQKYNIFICIFFANSSYQIFVTNGNKYFRNLHFLQSISFHSTRNLLESGFGFFISQSPLLSKEDRVYTDDRITHLLKLL